MGKGALSRYGCAVKLLELIAFLRRPHTYRDITIKFNCSRKTATRMVMALENDLKAPIIFDSLGLDETTDSNDKTSHARTKTLQIEKRWIYQKFIL